LLDSLLQEKTNNASQYSKIAELKRVYIEVFKDNFLVGS